MATSSSTGVDTSTESEAALDRAAQPAVARFLVDAALQSQRAGTLEDLVRRHPRAARWLMRKHLRVLRGAAGDALPQDALPQAASLLLRWLVIQLRPDAQIGFERISDDAWLHLPGWRPMLAMSCHLGLIAVPDFPRLHRRSHDEAALDNLCGLWNVDGSTLYRILDKARSNIGKTLVDASPTAARRFSLRDCVAELLHQQAGRGGGVMAEKHRRSWHSRQVRWALNSNDPASALWHCLGANDANEFIRVLVKFAPSAAVDVETDSLVGRAGDLSLTPRERFNLALAGAALARTRNLPDRESHAYDQARQVAQDTSDPLLLGIVYSAMGKFYESRDADRAFACYQDSAEFLRDLGPGQDDSQAIEHFVTTFARLAWLYLLRNDDRSKAVLDRAEELRSHFRVPDEVLGMLEQVWGQYWRRAGNSERSLEHRFRALNIFERVGDQRSVLAACVNISFDLASRGDHQRAIEYAQRVLEAAKRGQVDSAVIVSARLNLGASYFWKHDPNEAILQYQLALRQSLESDLRLHAFRARYNLAEAHFLRFRERADAADEIAGDSYIEEVIAAPSSESIRDVVEAARMLKDKVMGVAKRPDPMHLIPNEQAVHFDEVSEIHRQREILAVPADPEPHARAHLAIARSYLAIAAKEREAALALVQRANLVDKYQAEFTELQEIFERGLTREQQLTSVWKTQASDLLDDARRASLIAHLHRDGAINKSRYAELGAVSPATASKHLATLTERGLLVQQGKGPSTRYVLPG
jgi:tetratricopeptide (TPR) repeat protein